MHPADIVNRMNDMEAEGKPAYYVYIAKAALWIVSLVLFAIVGVGAYKLAWATATYWVSLDTSPVTVQAVSQIGGNVIAAAQALGVICSAVLG